VLGRWFDRQPARMGAAGQVAVDAPGALAQTRMVST
jgi:hypothetical protein